MRKLFGLVVLAMMAGTAMGQKKPVATLRVGVTTRVFQPKDARNWRGQKAQELRTVVWYPAVESAVETRQVVGPPDAPLFEAGMAATGAPLAATKKGWPLVLLSHGSGGSAMQMAWLGTALARAGYVAVAMDHPGNNSNNPMTVEGMALWWERATDMSQVLDGMLDDAEFGKKIDQDRVGAAGYSLGGYTVMELAGAQTDIGEFFSLCREKPDTGVCHTAEMRGMGSLDEMLQATRETSGESLARSGESFRDDRVRAVFAMAPALGFTLTDESLRAIKVPVAMVVGEADQTAPARDNADWIKMNVRGARVTLLPHVRHYTFLDVCTAQGKQALERYCTEESGVEREAVHARVEGMVVDFLARTLR